MRTPDIIQYVCWSTYLVAFVAICYMITQYRRTKQLGEGTDAMKDLAFRIRDGAKEFVKTLYKHIAIVGILLAIGLFFLMGPIAGLCFIVGLVLTAIAELIGMSVATLANVRTAATALSFKDIPIDDSDEDKKANAAIANTTITASQICGLVVMTAGLLGYASIVLLSPWSDFFAKLGQTAIPIVSKVTAYSLGWSIMAMFARVPGGIFTKAADIGADLIGKIEMHFKEDDARNPAVLADFVGDNVNDIKGNMADLGESFVATPVTSLVAAVVSFANPDNQTALIAAIAFPFFLMVGGLIGSIVGLFYASHAKKSKKPDKQINISLFIAAGFSLVSGLIGSIILFRGSAIPESFKLGSPTAFICAILGIAAGVIVGFVAKYFTDLDSPLVQKIAKRARQSVALGMSEAQIVGWISVPCEVIVVALASYLAGKLGSVYGTAIMATGMLSFIAQPISADAFGPIADNAGGITESCNLGDNVRGRTDKMDAFGNSSAAVGKGFAICSAAAVVLSQIKTFCAAANLTSANLYDDEVLFGFLIGGSLMAFFCGLLWKYTNEAADEMAKECREQLTKDDVKSGKKLPDSNRCISIATKDAIKRMVTPVVIVVLETLFVGFIFGPEAMAGCLGGTSLVGIILAIYFSNAGGAADNAKKRYEAKKEENPAEKFVFGSDEYEAAHDATVACDTVGDGQKDVVAVSCDIFMKIMGTLATMLAPMFSQYALIPALL